MTYYTTKGAAQALADTLAAQDADAWLYEVHASPRGFYVAVFDFDHFFFGEPMKDIIAALTIAAALTACALAYFDVLVK